jgi:hypothetical protein
MNIEPLEALGYEALKEAFAPVTLVYSIYRKMRRRSLRAIRKPSEC